MTALFILGSAKTLFSTWFFHRSYQRYNDLDNANDLLVASTYMQHHWGYLILGVFTIISAVGDFVQNYQV